MNFDGVGAEKAQNTKDRVVSKYAAGAAGADRQDQFRRMKSFDFNKKADNYGYHKWEKDAANLLDGATDSESIERGRALLVRAIDKREEIDGLYGDSDHKVWTESLKRRRDSIDKVLAPAIRKLDKDRRLKAPVEVESKSAPKPKPKLKPKKEAPSNMFSALSVEALDSEPLLPARSTRAMTIQPRKAKPQHTTDVFRDRSTSVETEHREPRGCCERLTQRMYSMGQTMMSMFKSTPQPTRGKVKTE